MNRSKICNLKLLNQNTSLISHRCNLSAKNVEHKFIVPNSVEIRDYQVNLANQAKNENSLIILPTGLGKTVVALHVIADYLTKGNGGVLFLAPTKAVSYTHLTLPTSDLV